MIALARVPRIHAMLVVTLCAAMLCLATPEIGCAQENTGTLSARLDGLEEGFMLREQVPGVIAVVVSGDTAILRGLGSRPRRPQPLYPTP